MSTRKYETNISVQPEPERNTMRCDTSSCLNHPIPKLPAIEATNYNNFLGFRNKRYADSK